MKPSNIFHLNISFKERKKTLQEISRMQNSHFPTLSRARSIPFPLPGRKSLGENLSTRNTSKQLFHWKIATA